MSAQFTGVIGTTTGKDTEARLDAFDWQRVGKELGEYGSALLPGILSPEECQALAGLYTDDGFFRSRVIMGRHGFGRGEYKYFSYPLPDIIQGLRTALYHRLAPVANRWNAAMGIDVRYPEQHGEFVQRCHRCRTAPADAACFYNMAKAITTACIRMFMASMSFRSRWLSCCRSPTKDFTGGEFVLTEQRPRMQSRPEVVPLGQGDAVAFAVHHRPVQGTRGTYRVNLRHGVSRLRSGRRHTAGIIFHDAT